MLGNVTSELLRILNISNSLSIKMLYRRKNYDQRTSVLNKKLSLKFFFTPPERLSFRHWQYFRLFSCRLPNSLFFSCYNYFLPFYIYHHYLSTPNHHLFFVITLFFLLPCSKKMAGRKKVKKPCALYFFYELSYLYVITHRCIYIENYIKIVRQKYI